MSTGGGTGSPYSRTFAHISPMLPFALPQWDSAPVRFPALSVFSTTRNSLDSTCQTHTHLVMKTEDSRHQSLHPSSTSSKPLFIQMTLGNSLKLSGSQFLWSTVWEKLLGLWLLNELLYSKCCTKCLTHNRSVLRVLSYIALLILFLLLPVDPIGEPLSILLFFL